jgi:hypothetical protein
MGNETLNFEIKSLSITIYQNSNEKIQKYHVNSAGNLAGYQCIWPKGER